MSSFTSLATGPREPHPSRSARAEEEADDDDDDDAGAGARPATGQRPPVPPPAREVGRPGMPPGSTDATGALARAPSVSRARPMARSTPPRAPAATSPPRPRRRLPREI